MFSGSIVMIVRCPGTRTYLSVRSSQGISLEGRGPDDLYVISEQLEVGVVLVGQEVSVRARRRRTLIAIQRVSTPNGR